MSPIGDTHATAHHWLDYYLTYYSEIPGHGKVRCSGTLAVACGPDDVVVPEVHLFTIDQLPYATTSEDYAELVPNLLLKYLVKMIGDRKGSPK